MTNADNPNYTSLDALKYLAREVINTIEWTLDSLSGNGVSEDDHYEIEALWGLAEQTSELLGPLVEDWNHYSDGREISSQVEIEYGHVYEHRWHPDPTVDKPSVSTGRLLADPGEDNGTYEVRIVPPQSVTVHRFPKGPGNVVPLRRLE
ncbi:hypothetical protein [Nocardia flavorosea]|uniref:Uncharacterized protein n=1 Tax=Nocardia flavorosea TaxID=53429 RepID=A0A846YSE0_9NOCA|nr:hypothetical protein [Nocardia flavorosea]NKY60348.1 hypothetical protein [Nocardia flavorosea]